MNKSISGMIRDFEQRLKVFKRKFLSLEQQLNEIKKKEDLKEDEK